jgi:hypothetical protein
MKGSIEERNDRWKRKVWVDKIRTTMESMHFNMYESMAISPHMQGRAIDLTLDEDTDNNRRRWIAHIGFQPVVAPQYINVNINVTPNV